MTPKRISITATLWLAAATSGCIDGEPDDPGIERVAEDDLDAAFALADNAALDAFVVLVDDVEVYEEPSGAPVDITTKTPDPVPLDCGSGCCIWSAPQSPYFLQCCTQDTGPAICKYF
jgi:hypothetical protein